MLTSLFVALYTGQEKLGIGDANEHCRIIALLGDLRWKKKLK
jgi:hypothetical protein